MEYKLYIGLLVTFVFSLRLQSQLPIEIFQKYAMIPGTIGVLLHTLQLSPAGMQTLLRLLKHSRIPFQHYYIDGCFQYMTKSRFIVVMATLKKEQNWIHRSIVLPLQCLAECRDYSGKSRFFADEIQLLGPTYLFDDFSEIELPLVDDHQIYASNLETLAYDEETPTYHFPDIIQNCSLLWSKYTPHSLLLESTSRYLGEGYGWMAFHHSCFDPHMFPNERIFLVMDWLVNERPLEALQVKTIDEVSDLARWCLHLILILLKLSYLDHQALFVGFPIQQYLTLLMLKVVNVRAQSKDDELKRRIDLLKRLINAGLNLSSKKMTAGLKFKIELPNSGELALLITSDLPDRLFDSWQLILLDFYSELGTLGPQTYLKEAIKNVGPIEQLPWIMKYLEASNSLHFLRTELVEIVKADTRMQKYILQHFKFVRWSKTYHFIVESIPVATRLRAAREEMMRNKKFCEVIFSIFKKFSGETKKRSAWRLRQDFMIRTMVTGFMRQLFDGKKFIEINTSESSYFQIELLPASQMMNAGIIFSTASIFQIPLGIQMDPAQPRTLLGYEKTIDLDMISNRFPVKSSMSDSTALESIRYCIQVSEFAVPPFLSWDELMQNWHLI